mmetsp:Transcript_17206/g.37126  ORF Transcript_17206/g.37126 Transcript_17206/m.37126 type:complete len:282 (-) Transcript_17206:2591-3436(-)
MEQAAHQSQRKGRQAAHCLQRQMMCLASSEPVQPLLLVDWHYRNQILHRQLLGPVLNQSHQSMEGQRAQIPLHQTRSRRQKVVDSQRVQAWTMMEQPRQRHQSQMLNPQMLMEPPVRQMLRMQMPALQESHWHQLPAWMMPLVEPQTKNRACSWMQLEQQAWRLLLQRQRMAQLPPVQHFHPLDYLRKQSWVCLKTPVHHLLAWVVPAWTLPQMKIRVHRERRAWRHCPQVPATMELILPCQTKTWSFCLMVLPQLLHPSSPMLVVHQMKIQVWMLLPYPS